MLPDPPGQVLARRVRQAVHLVQVVVIEHVVQRLPRGGDVREVEHPAGRLRDRAYHVDLDAERVAMQALALVPGRDIRQAVRRLERELLENGVGHDSAGSVNPASWKPLARIWHESQARHGLPVRGS